MMQEKANKIEEESKGLTSQEIQTLLTSFKEE